MKYIFAFIDYIHFAAYAAHRYSIQNRKLSESEVDKIAKYASFLVTLGLVGLTLTFLFVHIIMQTFGYSEQFFKYTLLVIFFLMGILFWFRYMNKEYLITRKSQYFILEENQIKKKGRVVILSAIFTFLIIMIVALWPILF